MRTTFADTLIKAVKAPAGFSPIPGSKRGGFHMRRGKGWVYWYPDGNGIRNAAHKDDEEAAGKAQQQSGGRKRGLPTPETVADYVKTHGAKAGHQLVQDHPDMQYAPHGQVMDLYSEGHKLATGGGKGGGGSGDGGGGGDGDGDDFGDGSGGAAAGYGTHNLEPGDKVLFEAGDFKGAGTIAAADANGAIVRDNSGREHHVGWHEIRDMQEKHAKPDGEGGEKPPQDAKPEIEDGANFSATDYASKFDDPNATVDTVLAKFTPDTASKIAEVQRRLEGLETTVQKFKQDGKYTKERKALHDVVIATGLEKDVINEDTGEPERKFLPGLLSAERVAKARPPAGQQPTLCILGGRGGSGKSKFRGMVYDPEKVITLDADTIKEMLPEYEGWNAAEIHDESGELFDKISDMARTLGCNVVLDATLKTAKSALARVDAFKGSGYRVEAHYMHLPRIVAAERAVHRFLGKTKRYVPVEVVLGMTTNEASFDQVRQKADFWSFRDNNVARGQEPRLIAQGGTKA
uniref:Zeta toxin domain containing protein n=1 Tax=uncultured Caudovirales phage TaxID=2100421 RepID=A0A6J5LA91_9CAUD|nr:Zeta toxin domain containing protein [uncultured Caudovirales phage]